MEILGGTGLKNIFITGSSGYFGNALIRLFDAKDEVERIVGIDIKPPEAASKKLEFIRHDVRDDLSSVLAGRDIDCVIHAAYVLDPIHDTSLMEDININGTKNVLAACVGAGIKQIMDCSSSTAYGFHPDNPDLLTEESPLRGNDDFTYSKNKKEIESIIV